MKMTKKPIYSDYIKEYDPNKPEADYLYNADLERYCTDLKIYCEELERQKRKAINALAKEGCESCPKWKYCCKHHTTMYGCKKVLREYLERR